MPNVGHTRSRAGQRGLVILCCLLALTQSLCLAQGTYQEEADRLAVLLDWQPTRTVAEIGAGHGQLTLAAAKRVGKIYSTELDDKLLTNLQQLAETEKKIVAIKAAETETILPNECCDSVVMRSVYHHLTRPLEIDASLFCAVKPGGLLAVIDEEPPANSSPPEGVPKNRGGHGMPRKLLIEELTYAGFQVVKIVDDWPSTQDNRGYCAVFRKTTAQGTFQEEADKLAALLDWQPNSAVAEIGAGRGQLTLAAVKHVGKIYSTELNDDQFTILQQLAERGEKNIVPVKAAETETNLPEACCDSIFMRLVYHHLTKPLEIDASLFRTLKPGGLLAVIDEEPPANTSPPEGVPKNRVGHGMPQKLLVEELTSAGFQVVKSVDDWPNQEHPANHRYCAVFRKPSM